MTVLKYRPHGVHAEPSDFRVEASLWLPRRHDEGTKSLPAPANHGGGLHRVESEAEVQTTPIGIKTPITCNGPADYNSVLTHRLRAGSDIGRRNGTVRERAEGRGWKSRKHTPIECSRAAVDDSRPCYDPSLKLFGQPAQCSNQFFPALISVM
jgi:hypothetical protein